MIYDLDADEVCVWEGEGGLLDTLEIEHYEHLFIPNQTCWMAQLTESALCVWAWSELTKAL